MLTAANRCDVITFDLDQCVSCTVGRILGWQLSRNLIDQAAQARGEEAENMHQESIWSSGDKLFDTLLLALSGVAFTLMMALLAAAYGG